MLSAEAGILALKVMGTSDFKALFPDGTIIALSCQQIIEKLHGLPPCKVYLAQSRVLSHANFKHVSGHHDSPRKGKNGSFLAMSPHHPQVIRE